LKITDTRVRLVNNEDSKLKAIASITIEECFVVHDIRVLEGQQGYFVRMPNRKTPDGQYKDVAHPINTETREYVNKVVLEALKQKKQNLRKNNANYRPINIGLFLWINKKTLLKFSRVFYFLISKKFFCNFTV